MLQVLYTLLMPATSSEQAIDFQYGFLCSEYSDVALEMLTKNNFLSKADVATKK